MLCIQQYTIISTCKLITIQILKDSLRRKEKQVAADVTEKRVKPIKLGEKQLGTPLSLQVMHVNIIMDQMPNNQIHQNRTCWLSVTSTTAEKLW